MITRTRTELYSQGDKDLIVNIKTMEEGGWSVRQIATTRYATVVVVYEREA